MSENINDIRDFIGPMPLTVLVFDEEDCFYMGTLADFLADNEDLEYIAEDLKQVGNRVFLGGGAAPLVEIMRCCPFCHDPNGLGTLDLDAPEEAPYDTYQVDCPRCPDQRDVRYNSTNKERRRK